jgi:hypothetical protein
MPVSQLHMVDFLVVLISLAKVATTIYLDTPLEDGSNVNAVKKDLTGSYFMLSCT